jgi:hypothetical protein
MQNDAGKLFRVAFANGMDSPLSRSGPLPAALSRASSEGGTPIGHTDKNERWLDILTAIFVWYLYPLMWSGDSGMDKPLRPTLPPERRDDGDSDRDQIG